MSDIKTIQLSSNHNKPKKSFDKKEINSLIQSVAYSCNTHTPLYIDPKTVWHSILFQFYLIIRYNSNICDKYIRTKGVEYWTSTKKDMLSELFLISHNAILDKELYRCFVDTTFSTTMPFNYQITPIMFFSVFENSKNQNIFLTDGKIEEINIIGTLNDWKLVKQKTSEMFSFLVDLPHLPILQWYNDLNILIDQFINEKKTYQVKDINFWKNFATCYCPNNFLNEKPYMQGHCAILNYFIVNNYNNLDVIKNGKLYLEDMYNECTTLKVSTSFCYEEYILKIGNISRVELKKNNFYIKPDYKINCINEEKNFFCINQ